jgi:hypothetical protein
MSQHLSDLTLAEVLRFRPIPNPPDPATLMQLFFADRPVDQAARGKVLQAYLGLQQAQLTATQEYLKEVQGALKAVKG